MKSFIGTIVVVLFVAIIGGYLISNLSAQKKELEFENARKDLKMLFLEKDSHLRNIEDTAAYNQERARVLRWYFAELDAIYDQFGLKRNVDEVLNWVNEQAKEGRIDQNTKTYYEEYFKTTKAVFEQLLSGKYSTVLSQGVNGFRLDLTKVTHETVEKEPGMRFDFLIWGVPREPRERAGDKNSTSLRLLYSKMGMNIFVDDPKEKKEKSFGQINWESSQPPSMVPNPERWIKDFPPQVTIGYYQFPLLPNEGKRAEITINYETRGDAGNMIPFPIKFNVTDIPADWKLPQGSAWKAQEMEEGALGE